MLLATERRTPDRVGHFTPIPNSFAFRHFPQLDGLRGLAIVLVVTGHVLQFGFGIARAGSLGGLGVLLFFVLSGFLITGLLDREMLETGDISVSRFYIRRILRLFPALFCFLGVLCVLIKVGAVRYTPWYTIIACVLYVRNIWGRGPSSGHLWSLSIEEQFYTFWPFILLALKRRFALWIALASTVAISAFRMVAISLRLFDYNAGVFYERSWFRFDSLLVGCALALFLAQRGYFNWFRPSSIMRIIQVLPWPILLTWTILCEPFSHIWYLTVQMLLAAFILLGLVISPNDSIYVKAFSHPVAAWLGKISYGWYLWQQLFTVFPPDSWMGLRTFPSNVLISLFLAIVSQRVIERPFLKLKDRIS